VDHLPLQVPPPLERLFEGGLVEHRSEGFDEPSFASELESLIDAASPREGAPRVVADPNGVWLYVDWPGAELPERGWKLHVSATPWNASDVLARCVPVLVAERATFKVAASPRRVAELNQGVAGARQAGKFVTVYPSAPDHAVRAARKLDDVTAGMRGPRVLTDRALSASSLVQYRYGDFALRAGEDDASTNAEARPEDPFVAAGVAPEPRVRLVAGRYLITANLHRSVRGAIHLAVDAKERKTCVLKRAWRDAALMPDGTDARDRLRDEAAILKEFAGDPRFPAVEDVVEDELDLFLVMEHLEGRTLAQVVHELHEASTPPGEDAIARWGIELAGALERIHGAGLVHRDLNPVNVIVADGGRVCLIDFELVQRQGERRDSYGAGTVGYMSPAQASGDAASALDDLYGLGALLFFATTGADPPSSVDEAATTLESRAGAVSRELAGVITRCLSFDSARRASAAKIGADLERALRS
jgi:tRNA A-37 threonylcarbamoyl transferase component Bud32